MPLTFRDGEIAAELRRLDAHLSRKPHRTNLIEEPELVIAHRRRSRGTRDRFSERGADPPGTATHGLSGRLPRARAVAPPPTDRRCNREVACRRASGETAPCDEIDFPACGRTQLRRRAPDESAPTTGLFPDSNDSARLASDVA